MDTLHFLDVSSGQAHLLVVIVIVFLRIVHLVIIDLVFVVDFCSGPWNIITMIFFFVTLEHVLLFLVAVILSATTQHLALANLLHAVIELVCLPLRLLRFY